MNKLESIEITAAQLLNLSVNWAVGGFISDVRSACQNILGQDAKPRVCHGASALSGWFAAFSLSSCRSISPLFSVCGSSLLLVQKWDFSEFPTFWQCSNTVEKCYRRTSPLTLTPITAYYNLVIFKIEALINCSTTRKEEKYTYLGNSFLTTWWVTIKKLLLASHLVIHVWFDCCLHQRLFPTQPQRDLAPLQSKAVIFHFLGKCVNHVLYYY